VLARAGNSPRVVAGATYGWYWAAGTLAAAGAGVHLAHPLGVKAFSCRRVKNDVRDCTGLADLLRMGRLPEAWIAPQPVRELRELTRYRVKLVRARSSAKDQVHAVLAKPGIPVPCPDLFGAFGPAWLDGLRLPQPYGGKVTSLRQLAGWLTSEVGMLDEVIADFLGDWPPCQAVLKLPGIGPVPAAVIIAETGDVSRFPSPGHLCSWAGLTPKHVSPMSRPPAGTSRSRARPSCGGRWRRRSGTSPPAARPASSRTPSPPAAARRPGTSPGPRRPASCSPAPATRCATGKSGPWPPATAPQRPREQARTRAAGDRPQAWPPPSGTARPQL
jgi:hypothetical protein